jgi:hypothetical protein
VNDLLTNLAPYKAIFGYYLLTLFGSGCMYVFSLHRKMPVSTTPVIKRLFPDKEDVFYNRVDFVIVVFAGSIIGSILYQPKGLLPAFAAGFGWVSSLSVLASQGQSKVS